MLMQIQEYVQLLTRLMGQVNGVKGIPEFQSVPRPFYEPGNEEAPTEEQKQANSVARFVNSVQRRKGE